MSGVDDLVLPLRLGCSSESDWHLLSVSLDMIGSGSLSVSLDGVSAQVAGRVAAFNRVVVGDIGKLRARLHCVGLLVLKLKPCGCD